MITNRRILTTRFIYLLLLSLSLTACGQAKQKKGDIPIYVTPYYNSKGLNVNVGEFSDKLAKADAANIHKTLSEMKSQWPKLRAEAMFVAAIRLYDLGLKDESAYWFYSAQYRAMLLTKLLDPTKIGGIGSKAFELKQAFASFHQLAGEYINGYAFGDPEKLSKSIAKVQTEGKTIPLLKQTYPDITFLDEKQWANVNTKINSGLGGMMKFLKTNGKQIKAQRKENGIEGKY